MRLTPDKHLHSKEHLLADDLSRMLLEPTRFGAYLGVARMYEESDLRGLARRVVEKEGLDPKNRGRYFFGALRGLMRRADWKRKSAVSKKPLPRHVKTTDRTRTKPSSQKRRQTGAPRPDPRS